MYSIKVNTMAKTFKAYVKKNLGIEPTKKENYGQELILDIHDVPAEFFTKKNLREFAEKLCDEINMRRGPFHIWGEEKQLDKAKKGEGAIKADGLSCVQFLYTSSITVHALDEIQKVFVNVFSCNKFDSKKAIKFTEDHIGGKLVESHTITRK